MSEPNFPALPLFQDLELESPQQVLESVFGYREFRPGQREIIDAVLAGRDCIGVMPTGAASRSPSRSPRKLLRGTVLVISPLISLMKDQVDALDAARLPRHRAQLDASTSRSGAGGWRRCGAARSSWSTWRPKGSKARCARSSPTAGRAWSSSTRRTASATGATTFGRPIAGSRDSRRSCGDDPGAGAHRDRDAARGRRHHPPARHAEARRLQGLVLPPQPAHHGARARAAKGAAKRDTRRDILGIVRQHTRRERHRLLPEPQSRWTRWRRGWSQRGVRALPYHAGLDRRGAHAQPGRVRARRVRRDRRDGRVRHGDRQEQRAVRDPPRHAEERRGVVPGDRPRRPRRARQRLRAVLLVGRRDRLRAFLDDIDDPDVREETQQKTVEHVPPRRPRRLPAPGAGAATSTRRSSRAARRATCAAAIGDRGAGRHTAPHGAQRGRAAAARKRGLGDANGAIRELFERLRGVAQAPRRRRGRSGVHRVQRCGAARDGGDTCRSRARRCSRFSGVGPAKLERYGDAFLEVLRRES